MASWALSIVTVLAAVVAGAEAGCYRGRPKPLRSRSELYWNHVPARQQTLEQLPEEFSWCASFPGPLQPRGRRRQRHPAAPRVP